MSRPDIKKEFPFMRVIMPKVVGSCCGGNRQAQTQKQVLLDNVKRQLMSMPEDKKRRFKELTRVAQVVIFIAGSQRFTF